MVPVLLLNRDIAGVRSRDGIKRAVFSVLRELGILPPAPPAPKRPPLRVVKGEEPG